jgi:hypothetical protein
MGRGARAGAKAAVTARAAWCKRWVESHIAPGASSQKVRDRSSRRGKNPVRRCLRQRQPAAEEATGSPRDPAPPDPSSPAPGRRPRLRRTLALKNRSGRRQRPARSLQHPRRPFCPRPGPTPAGEEARGEAARCRSFPARAPRPETRRAAPRRAGREGSGRIPKPGTRLRPLAGFRRPRHHPPGTCGSGQGLHESRSAGTRAALRHGVLSGAPLDDPGPRPFLAQIHRANGVPAEAVRRAQACHDRLMIRRSLRRRQIAGGSAALAVRRRRAAGAGARAEQDSRKCRTGDPQERSSLGKTPSAARRSRLWARPRDETISPRRRRPSRTRPLRGVDAPPAAGGARPRRETERRKSPPDRAPWTIL